MTEFEIFSKRIDLDKIFEHIEITHSEVLLTKYPGQELLIYFHQLFWNKESLGYFALIPDKTGIHHTFKLSEIHTVEEIEKEIRDLKHRNEIKYPNPLEMKITERK